MRSGSLSHIGSVYALGLIAFIPMGMAGPLAGDLARAFAAPIQTVGIAIGLQLCCGAFGGAPLGWLIDRLGAGLVMLVGCGLIVGTALAIAVAPNLWALSASLLVQGIGLIGVILSGQVTFSAPFGGEAQQVRRLALWSTVPFVGVALGLLLAAPFADSERWRYALLVQAGLGALGMLLVLPLPRVNVMVRRTSIFAVFRERRIVSLTLGFALISLAGQGSNAVIPLYLHRAHGVPVAAAASVLAIANLAAIGGSVSTGLVLARGYSPARILLTIAMLGVGGGIATFAPAVAFSAAAAGLILFTVAMGAVMALVYALIPRVASDSGSLGPAVGLVSQGSGLGVLFGAPLFFSIYASGAWFGFMAVAVTAWLAMLALAPVRGLAQRDQLLSEQRGA